MTFERLEVPVAGATLIGDRWAGKGPAIVLLHAGVCDRRCWRDVGERLGGNVVAYDRRGYGDVPPAGAAFRHVDDLLAVIDAVSPSAPAWLVGSSMGGGVVLDAALEAPARVAGLVLLAPAVPGDPEPDEAALIAETDGLVEALDDAWTKGDFETLNDLEMRLWLDGPAGPEGRVGGVARELALEMNRIVIANDAAAEFDGAGGLDTASRVGEITAPAVVVCGELDLPSKIQRSRELAGSLPNAAFHALPGRAHLPYLEEPDEVAALLRRTT